MDTAKEPHYYQTLVSNECKYRLMNLYLYLKCLRVNNITCRKYYKSLEYMFTLQAFSVHGGILLNRQMLRAPEKVKSVAHQDTNPLKENKSLIES